MTAAIGATDQPCKGGGCGQAAEVKGEATAHHANLVTEESYVIAGNPSIPAFVASPESTEL
jgi:hypothetical protein